MKEYLYKIAKIDKNERFKAIINILSKNKIDYKIQPILGYASTGNIIVEFCPNNDKKIILCAHYDNVKFSPAANDNAASCAILLNIIINNKHKINSHVEFVFTDLEELGFIGSRYYLEQNKNKIKQIINLDMCGVGEHILISIDNVQGKNYNIDNQMIKDMDEFGLIYTRLLPPGDATVFIKEKIPTYYVVSSTTNDLTWFKSFSEGVMPKFMPEFAQTMHSPKDTIDKINMKQVNKVYDFVTKLVFMLCEINI